MNKALDEIINIYNVEIQKEREQGQDAAFYAQSQISIGMTWFSALVSILFVGLTILVSRLIQQRRRHLAERSRLFKQAQSAIQSRDEVIAAVGFDFKEPMAEITQAASHIPTEQAELIQSSVLLIEDRISDISDQAKADAGLLSLRLEQAGLDGVLDEARLRMQPLAKQKDIRLEMIPVNPPVLAFLDSERVLKVLTNLINNAIKFSPKFSRIVVRVRSDQQFVYVSVKDSGSGIPEKQLAGLFDYFWQARNTAEQGAGVGLAVVKTVITAHGGTVRADSQLGQGTTITFSLPRRRPVGLHLRRSTAATVRNSAQVQEVNL